MLSAFLPLATGETGNPYFARQEKKDNLYA
jgi:hypothetical protein